MPVSAGMYLILEYTVWGGTGVVLMWKTKLCKETQGSNEQENS